VLFAFQQAATPYVVEIAGEATRETQVSDILFGAVGLVVVGLFLALVAGVLVGALFIRLRARRRLTDPQEDAAVELGLSAPVFAPPSAPQPATPANGRR
jgi:ABC-type nitrate/sulfonate/bicarbonate transport system permease component